MKNPFRRSQTPPEAPQTREEYHGQQLELFEQVAYMRGQIGSLEAEWKGLRDQLRKDYQRVEKANERSERRHDDSETSESVRDGVEPPVTALTGFALKLHQMKGA